MQDQASLSLVLNNIPYLVIQNQFCAGTYNIDFEQTILYMFSNELKGLSHEIDFDNIVKN